MDQRRQKKYEEILAFPCSLEAEIKRTGHRNTPRYAMTSSSELQRWHSPWALKRKRLDEADSGVYRSRRRIAHSGGWFGRGLLHIDSDLRKQENKETSI